MVALAGILTINVAGAAQSEALECKVQSLEVPIGNEAVISCVFHPPEAGGGGQRANLALELLDNSVNDGDGTSAPADMEQDVDASGAAIFRFTGTGAGVDSVCIWVPGDDGGRGPLGCESDDYDTELIELVWVRASQSPATASPAGSASLESPPSAAGDPDDEGATVGFALVADHELSLAIDAFLVAVAAVALWRSRWIRAVVMESVRHPRTPSSVEVPASRPPRDRSTAPGNGDTS